MRNYWGKADLPEPTKPWRARVWLNDRLMGRPVVETEAMMWEAVKKNAEAKLRELVDMDGQIIWVRGPREESKDMDDEYDEWDAREANERADEEHERMKDFAEVQWVPTGRQGGGSSAFQCKLCGCLVLNVDQHRWKCGDYIDERAKNTQGWLRALQTTLGVKPQGDEWQTVADRLRWIHQRLEYFVDGLGRHQKDLNAHTNEWLKRGPSDAPGGPEAAARAQRTLDDDWAWWGGIQREASKRLGQAIDRYLKGGK